MRTWGSIRSKSGIVLPFDAGNDGERMGVPCFDCSALLITALSVFTGSSFARRKAPRMTTMAIGRMATGTLRLFEREDE